MSLPIVLRAEAEFDGTFDWYDARRVGLGSAFVAAVQSVLDGIAANPLGHGMVLADIRKAVVRRFPYRVFNRPQADRVEVLAVFRTTATRRSGKVGRDEGRESVARPVRVTPPACGALPRTCAACCRASSG